MNYGKYIAHSRPRLGDDFSRPEFFTCNDLDDLLGWVKEQILKGYSVDIQEPQVIQAPKPK